MTTTIESPRLYEAAVKAMSQAAAEAEADHAPVRLAYWRMAALDSILGRLEDLRLANERVVPAEILELVQAYAERHDAELFGRAVVPELRVECSTPDAVIAEVLHRDDVAVGVVVVGLHDVLRDEPVVCPQ